MILPPVPGEVLSAPRDPPVAHKLSLGECIRQDVFAIIRRKHVSRLFFRSFRSFKMSADNPYASAHGLPMAGVLSLRDHLICGAVALLMWVASAAVLAAFAFGALVAFIGPYSELGGGMPDLSDEGLRQGGYFCGAAIATISTALATVTFIRVQRGRRKTTIIGQRRAELTRAVETMREDVKRIQAAENQRHTSNGQTSAE